MAQNNTGFTVSLEHDSAKYRISEERNELVMLFLHK